MVQLHTLGRYNIRRNVTKSERYKNGSVHDFSLWRNAKCRCSDAWGDNGRLSLVYICLATECNWGVVTNSWNKNNYTEMGTRTYCDIFQGDGFFSLDSPVSVISKPQSKTELITFRGSSQKRENRFLLDYPWFKALHLMCNTTRYEQIYFWPFYVNFICSCASRKKIFF